MKMTLSTIQPIGNSPKRAPQTAVLPAMVAGMPKAKIATASATMRPRIAAQCALTWKKARLPSNTRIGSAATIVDRYALPSGS